MYTRILVPLDGSARAEQALPDAARLARASRGSLILVQAVAPPPQYPPTYVPVEPIPYAAYETLEDEANTYLVRISQSDQLAGIPIECHAFLGPAAPQLLDAVTEYSADLVVMSSHGRSGLTRWILGSVAQHIVQHATIPVLIVRRQSALNTAIAPGSAELTQAVGPAPAEAASLPASDRTQPVRILVPLDGSPVAEAALTPAVELARALAVASADAAHPGAGNASIHLLLVVSPYYAVADNQPYTLLIDGAQTYLTRKADELSSAHPDVSVTWRVAVADDVATTIVRVAERGEGAGNKRGERMEGVGTDVSGPSTMIAIATHGRTGLERWTMGSIEERVLVAASLPLLAVHPHTGAVRDKAAVSSAINE